MPQTIYGQILFGSILIVCLLALWQGEKAERNAGALILFNTVVDFAIQHQTVQPLRGYLNLASDFVALALLCFIAWKSSRSWTIWAASCQAVTVAVIASRILGLKMMQSAYVSAVNLATYGVVAALAVGTFIIWREREALKTVSGGLR